MGGWGRAEGERGGCFGEGGSSALTTAQQQGQLVRCRAGGREGGLGGSKHWKVEGGGRRDGEGRGCTAPSRVHDSTNTVLITYFVLQ